MSLGRCLVLNAAFQPVEVCDCEDAIWDIMKGTAELVESAGELCHSQNLDVEIPSVIRQIKWHKPKSPTGKPRSLPLTPRNVCARDRHVCAYQIEGVCTGRATTRDHIIPTSNGGPNTWENVVATCRACNHKKGNKSLDELGWELKTKPWRPQGALARVLMHANQDTWMKYLN